MAEESAREQVERLNPHMKWCKRKVKREVKKRFKALIPNVTLAWGCRGHPAIVVEKYYSDQDVYGGGVELKSVIDDVVESCSLFHCNPQPITDPEALRRAYAFAGDAIVIGFKKAHIRHFIDDTRYWEEHFNKAKLNGGYGIDPRDPNLTFKDEYVLACTSAQGYLNMTDDEWAFYQAELVAQGKV